MRVPQSAQLYREAGPRVVLPAMPAGFIGSLA